MTTARAKSKRARAGRAAPATPRSRPVPPTRRTRAAGHAPRALILATGLALLVAVGLLGWDLTAAWRSAPPSADGQIAMPVAGGINLVDTASGRSRQLLAGEANASVTAVAWSPDRSTLAYTLFHRRPEDRVSSAELFTIPAAGGTPTLVVPRPQPGTVIDAPAWSPDGASIFFAYQGVENSKPVARIERVGVADSSRQTLYPDAAFPTVAPDGRGLAFVYDNGSGQALRVGSVDGGDAKDIINPSVFQGLMGPRFSPDGTWIAFEAQGPGPSGEAQPSPGGLAALLNVFRV